MRVLVTGGGGFLGLNLVQRLVQSGHQVCSLQRSPSPELMKLGTECLQGDLADVSAVQRAASGCELIYHVAAKAGLWGRYDDFYRANVVGTENVLSACRKLGIGKLVYTSSPSVVFDGRNEAGIDESAPYPQQFLSFYPQTKALAEQLVLAANGPTLATVSLRPHLIWGPGDNHLFPRLIQRARADKLRRVGNGLNLVDTTYVDNAAEAHLQAAARLHPGSSLAGKAYFISNGEPLPLWAMIDRLLACADLPPVKKGISATAAYALGAGLETIYKLAGITREPPMTRFVARQLATDHWFRLDAARRDFGYAPAISIDEGLRRLKASLNSKN